MLRVGCVPFINALPLTEGIRPELEFDDPATLSRKFLNHELDIALLPSVELLRYGGQLEPLVPLGIASYGAVRSIRLIARVPLEQIKTFRRDYQSRTSNALAQVLFQNRYGLAVTETDQSADAVLVIGNRALLTPPANYDYDLGALWTEWTGLPFVYALWVKHPHVVAGEWPDKLHRAYAQGKQNMPALVRQAALEIGITDAVASDYLNKHIQYELGEKHRLALRRFYDELAALEDLPPYAVHTWDRLVTASDIPSKF